VKDRNWDTTVGALYREDCGSLADSYIVLYGEGVLQFLSAKPLITPGWYGHEIMKRNFF
jgi:hypothetical protein